MIASIEAIGNWDAQIGASLSDALRASVEICGRTGEEACKHALILMAKSARALTRQAPKNRPIEHDFAFGKDMPFVTRFWPNRQPTRKYKFQYSKRYQRENPGKAPPGTWEQAKEIRQRGLAKRSWFWGLSKIGGPRSEGAPIPGVSRVYSFVGAKSAGYVKENRLGYLLRPGVMPGSWKHQVQTAAANKIMKQAANKLMMLWRQKMGYRTKGKNLPTLSNRELADYFKSFNEVT